MGGWVGAWVGGWMDGKIFHVSYDLSGRVCHVLLQEGIGKEGKGTEWCDIQQLVGSKSSCFSEGSQSSPALPFWVEIACK